MVIYYKRIKNLTIFFNCHGEKIKDYLSMNLVLINRYNINRILLSYIFIFKK